MQPWMTTTIIQGLRINTHARARERSCATFTLHTHYGRVATGEGYLQMRLNLTIVKLILRCVDGSHLASAEIEPGHLVCRHMVKL